MNASVGNQSCSENNVTVTCYLAEVGPQCQVPALLGACKMDEEELARLGATW